MFYIYMNEKCEITPKARMCVDGLPHEYFQMLTFNQLIGIILCIVLEVAGNEQLQCINYLL
jgi:hypothetical protein